MLHKTISTFLGLDLSINGTGISLISNDPKLKKLSGAVKLSKTKFSLINASFIKGDKNENGTRYHQKLWAPDGLVSSEKLDRMPLILRAHTVFHQYILPMLAYNPTDIVIEGYSYGSSDGRVFDIAEFTGQIKYLLEIHYLDTKRPEIHIVPPTKLKLYISGKGSWPKGESKQAMLNAVHKKYGIDLLNDNICDSFSLAIMAAELGEDLELFCEKMSPKELKEFKRKFQLAS